MSHGGYKVRDTIRDLISSIVFQERKYLEYKIINFVYYVFFHLYII